MFKKRALKELLIVRGAYCETLHNAIMEENTEGIQSWIDNVKNSDSDMNNFEKEFYNFNDPIDTVELKAGLTAMTNDMENARKSGRKFFGM